MKKFSSPWIRLVLVFINFFILSATAFANDYYVSPSGNDTNDGTQARPWATINHAIRSFALGANGTLIHVAAGSYTTSDSLCGISAGACVNRGGSSPSVRLVIQCDPGIASATAAIGQCRLTGGTSTGFIVKNASNITIQGFDITGTSDSGLRIQNNTSNAPAPFGNSVYFVGNCLDDIATTSCTLSGAVMINAGSAVSDLTDTRVIGNLILRYANQNSGSTCNTAHGIYSATGGARIENNVVVATTTSGIQFHSSVCGPSVISNNTLINANTGIILQQDKNTACPGSKAISPSTTTCSWGITSAISGMWEQRIARQAILTFTATILPIQGLQLLEVVRTLALCLQDGRLPVILSLLPSVLLFTVLELL